MSSRSCESLFQDHSLTQDQSELQSLVHNFMKRELPSDVAAKIDKDDNYPNFRELWKKMGSIGLHGITVPQRFGGLQLGYFEHCLVIEAMSQYSASLALSYGAHSNLTVNQISINGDDRQREEYLPKLIEGSWVGSLAMSEPNSGSDVTSMRTNATKKGDSYIINGTKFWITNGPVADLVVVYAKTGADHITAFLVEKDTPGFSVGRKINKMGMRGSPTGELIFENCVVPERNVIGGLNKGVYVLMRGLDYERLILAAGPLGIMQRACDVAYEYAHERTQFGQAIGKFQILQAMMADMYTETLFCRTTLYGIARDLDEHTKLERGCSTRKQVEKGPSDFTAKCAAVILRLAESASDVTDKTLQILGGNGYTEDYEASRLSRDARLYRIGAGTSEIRRWLIGREINRAFSKN